jgi:hypothetical protein
MAKVDGAMDQSNFYRALRNAMLINWAVSEEIPDELPERTIREYIHAVDVVSAKVFF